jgi:small redox-active disulfide protein 2
MKKIQILGTGCPKCKQLASNAEQAIRETGLEYEVEKITDIQQIMSFGVMMTPGLAVDGNVKSTGKILSPNEIAKIIINVEAERDLK